MTTSATPSAQQARERYLEAERRLWLDHAGREPDVHWAELPTLRSRVRLLELGEGPTLLFLHGGPSAAACWAPLVGRLAGFRCVVIERPGCGLSEPARASLSVREHGAGLLADVLADLPEPPIAVVANSFGSYLSLAHELAHPGVVARYLHFGCPAPSPGSRVPPAFVPSMIPGVNSLLRRLGTWTAESSLRNFTVMGHDREAMSRPALASFLRWYTALMTLTPTRANDQGLFARIRPRDALRPAQLAAAAVPMHFFWGRGDTFGGERSARRLTSLIAGSEVQLVDGGHLPWLDDQAGAAEFVGRVLDGR
ncbi:alpha/beta fold hydrolase [Agromyces sp. NPDC057679]|uniref:alpha/beta fold hydrolase n=1 Tax=Agromyces sp. NPDC057679 TaxID=3346207 RepID=UPI00366D396B